MFTSSSNFPMCYICWLRTLTLFLCRAKDKIKRFRRRRASTLSAATPDHTADDLPPPYSENPPVNPFYNEYLHAVDSSNPYSTPNSTVNSANVSTNEASFTHGGRMSLDARPQSNLVSPVVPPSRNTN